MNKAYLTVGLIMLSIIALVIINMFTSYSTGNELDYYLLRETTDAAMEDAVSGSFAREGITRIDKEKFVESFILRFSSTVDDRKCYNVKFYDINEVPPKVSVRVETATAQTSTDCGGRGEAEDGNSFKGQAISIVTELTSIVETNYKNNPGAQNYVNGKD